MKPEQARPWNQAGGADDGAPARRTPPPLPGEKRHPLLTWGAVVCGVLSLLLIAWDIGPAGFAMGTMIAIIPVPLYVMLALWLDRFEPEPGHVLAQTFAWGATVAVFMALLVNGLAEEIVLEIWGRKTADIFAALVSAPVVEELAKGFALWVLFTELKDEFDGVVDGVVYAAMVGLGFAMIENVQYYGRAVEHGLESSVLAFLLRGMMAPFAHPLFTSMIGIGLGYYREGHHAHPRRWPAVAGGTAAAIALHSLWNLAASFEGWFVVLYFAVMLPAFVAVIGLIYLSLKREGRVIREHLAHLVEQGVIPESELDCLCTVRRRLRASASALRKGGVAHWRARREMHRIASELAFHRWRVSRGLSLGPYADAVREAEYTRALSELCKDREW